MCCLALYQAQIYHTGITYIVIILPKKRISSNHVSDKTMSPVGRQQNVENTKEDGMFYKCLLNLIIKIHSQLICEC